ncbi:MAG: ribosome maturation factor RimM [Christensenellaceae bacterium]
MKQDKILIGIIVRPQGIYGELKLKDLSAGYDQLSDIKTVTVMGKEHKVLNVRFSAKDLYLTIDNVYDRNVAETYRGAEVYVDKSQLNIAKDEFLIVEVIGCELYLSSGKRLGEIFDISSGKVDVYSVKIDGKVAKFPMLKDLDPVFDIENNKVTVNAARFTEVVMYED